MKAQTESLWKKQDQHKGDRWRLFGAVAREFHIEKALYPGSYVDVAASLVFPDVTYVDVDSRAAAFFRDEDGVREIIGRHPGTPAEPALRFIHGDYREPLDLPDAGFDLLVSLYAGFVSEHCGRYLKVGGHLMANPSHGDVAMASIDRGFELAAVIISRSADYRVSVEKLDDYLVPAKPITLTRDSLHETGRGVAYTKQAFAYIFRKVDRPARGSTP